MALAIGLRKRGIGLLGTFIITNFNQHNNGHQRTFGKSARPITVKMQQRLTIDVSNAFSVS